MEIVVYSAKNCGYCTEQNRYLEKKGISYELKDIYETKEIFDEFKAIGGTGTPFTVIKNGNKIESTILGFDQRKLEALLFS